MLHRLKLSSCCGHTDRWTDGWTDRRCAIIRASLACASWANNEDPKLYSTECKHLGCFYKLRFTKPGSPGLAAGLAPGLIALAPGAQFNRWWQRDWTVFETVLSFVLVRILISSFFFYQINFSKWSDITRVILFCFPPLFSRGHQNFWT